MRILPFCFLALAQFLHAGSSFQMEPNHGQFAAEVRYAARLRHGSVQWTDRDTIFSRDQVAVRVELAGARSEAAWQPGQVQPGTTDYLMGRRSAGWIRQVPRYASLERKQVYPGIDWIAYAAGGTMEYDFVVAPGADPRLIRMRFDGAQDVRLRPNGDLEVVTAAGPLVQRRPVLYQLADGKRQPVEGRFSIAGTTVSFATGSYDRGRTLWIDPVLESATFWGGSAEDEVAYASREGYVVGTTTSVDLPNSASRRRGRDVFVAVPGRGTVVIGGSGDDVATAAFVDVASQFPTIHIVGYTDSPDLATTAGLTDQRGNLTEGFSLQPDYAGGKSDGFVITLRQSAASFFGPSDFTIFSATYFGSPGEDRVQGILAFRGGSLVLGLAGYSDAPGLPGRLGSQAAPKGGKDAFFSTLDVASGIAATTYLGGSGDDEARAVSFAGGYWIAGETRSPDFPGGGTRQGDSDAFLASLNSVFPTGGVAQVSRAWVFGGTGSDRINALSNFNGVLPLFAAGVTGSRDFPQSAGNAYGGGLTDAFVQRWLSPIAEGPEWSALVGGDGEDEALALSLNAFGGSLAIAGRTNSRSLPVVDAWQTAYGGGEWDGWLAGYDTARTALNLLTYFGGPGSDQILTVEDGGALTFGGVTSAGGWPEPATITTSYRGGTDGFAARLTRKIFQVQGPQQLPQDLVRPIGIGLGGTPSNQTVRIRSSDPNRLLVSSVPNEDGQSEITVTSSADSVTLYVHALASSGSASVLLSADGFTPGEVRFDFVPLTLRVISSNLSPRVPLVGQFSSPLTLSFNSSSFSDSLRAGVEPVRVRLTSTQPSIFRPSEEQVTLPDQFSSYRPIGVQPVGIGEAELVATALDREIAPARQALTVISPFTLFPTVPALRLMTGAQVAYNTLGSRTALRFRLTSSDPTRLLVSGSPTERGREVYEFTTNPSGNSGVFLQALGETGDVTLQVQINDGATESIPVRIVPPVLSIAAITSRGSFAFLTPGNQVVRGDVGEMLRFFVGIPGSGNLLRTPGFAPIVIPFVSSNPAVVEPTQIEIGGNTIGPNPTLNLRQPGTATIRAQPPAGVELEPGSESITVQVGEARFRVPDFELGNGLRAVISVALPPALRATTSSFVVESSDPDLMDLAGGGQFAGRISINNLFGGTSATILVRGKKDQGEATLTFSASNGAMGQTRVTLRPAGFVWENQELQSPLHLDTLFGSFRGVEPRVRAVALDPGTRLPIATQQGTGLDRIPVTSSNPAVGELATPTVPSAILSSNGGGAFFVPKSIGETTLTLSPPPGFLQPATGQTLLFRVTPSLIRDVQETVFLGQDLQVRYSFNLPYPRELNEEVTITSSDAGRVLVSDSPSRPGVASLRIQRDSAGAYPGVYLQALSGEGTATVTIQGPGIRDVVTTVQLRRFSIRLEPSRASNSGFQDTATGLELIAGPTPSSMSAFLDTDRRLGPGQSPQEYRLRPGAGPIDVDLVSLQPEIAVPVQTRLRFAAGESSQDFALRPTGIGNLELRAIVNNTMAGSLRLRVRRASFMAGAIALGRDQQIPLIVQIPPDTPRPSTPVIARFRSSDPSRLLLSNDPRSPGSAAVEGRAEQSGVILQAVTEGEATVVVSADGYEDTPIRVLVLPPALALSNPQRQTVNLQERSLLVPVTLSAVTDSLVPPFSWLSGQRRAGLGPLPVRVRTSNPGVAGEATGLIEPGEASLRLAVPLTGQGQARLELAADGHAVRDPASVEVEVRSERPQINGPTTLGRDFVAGLSVSTQTPFGSRTVTVTTSDPSRLTVSAAPNVPGQASVTLAANNNSFHVHALGDSGTVTLTVQIDGYQEATHRITLWPSGPVLEQERVTLRTDGVPAAIAVNVRELDPVTLQPGPAGQIRPGVSYVVGLRISDTAIAALAAPSLTFTFNSGGRSERAILRGVTPGSTLLRLVGPAGSSVASTGGTTLVSVDAAPIEAPPPMLLGRDQQSSFRSRLSQPAANAVMFTVSTSDPARLVLSRNPIQLGSSSLSVVVQAGQRESELLYVQSIGAPFPGSNLAVGGNSALGSWSMPVTVRDALVIFRPPPVQPLVLRRGGNTTSLIVLNGVAAQPGDPTPGPLYFRPGTSLRFSVTSTNPGVLAIGTITSNSLAISPADSNPEVFLIPLAVGTARVQLQSGVAAQTPATGIDVRVE